LQAGQTQYIQLPANYAQQHGLSAHSIIQATNAASAQAYMTQSPAHYIGAPQAANTNGSATNSASVVSSPTL
ncbi:unnamed protein product, partial [Rotaria magnacalcarata]